VSGTVPPGAIAAALALGAASFLRPKSIHAGSPGCNDRAKGRFGAFGRKTLECRAKRMAAQASARGRLYRETFYVCRHCGREGETIQKQFAKDIEPITFTACAWL